MSPLSRLIRGGANKHRLTKLRAPDGRAYWLSIFPGQDGYHAAIAQSRGIPDVGRVLWALTNPGDVLFDIGANIGTIAVPLALKGTTVHAFEMMPDNAARLSEAASASRVQIDIHETDVWEAKAYLDIEYDSAWARIRSCANRTKKADTSAVAVTGALSKGVLG